MILTVHYGFPTSQTQFVPWATYICRVLKHNFCPGNAFILGELIASSFLTNDQYNQSKEILLFFNWNMFPMKFIKFLSLICLLFFFLYFLILHFQSFKTISSNWLVGHKVCQLNSKNIEKAAAMHEDFEICMLLVGCYWLGHCRLL